MYDRVYNGVLNRRSKVKEINRLIAKSPESCLSMQLIYRLPPYEKLTNFGSLGLPSGPIPFFANLPSV